LSLLGGFPGRIIPVDFEQALLALARVGFKVN
jgi:hypothetical protein